MILFIAALTVSALIALGAYQGRQQMFQDSSALADDVGFERAA